MRLVLAMAFAGLVALPQSASANSGEERYTAGSRQYVFLPEHLRHSVRGSPKRPSQPDTEPVLQLELDSSGLDVTPTAPLAVEEAERQQEQRRKRRIAIGVTLSLLVVAVCVVVGMSQFNRSFEN